jgi:HlyD family secretion protein
MKEISGSTAQPSISTPEKHREAIIQSSGSRRVRRPGSGRQLRIIVFIFVIIAVAIAAAYFLLRPKDESYTLRDYSTAVVEVRTIQDDLQLGGTVRARTEATVRAPVSGILESLAVDVGDWVTPGQIVAVLDAETLQDSYKAQQRYLVQSTRVHESMLLAREQAKLISGRAREDIEAVLEETKSNLADAQELKKLGTITSAALKDAEDLVEAAQEALEDHDEDADIAEKFHQIEKLNSDDNLEAIREDIADLEEQLEETTITSSMEGRVVWTIDTITAVGNKIAENAAIMQVADTRDPFVETVIEEQYISDIALGQEVMITISGREFPGSIERIGLLAVTPSDGGPPEVDLDLSVEVENFEALPGGTALAELVVGVVPDALVLPRGPFLSTGNHLYLYKIYGSTAVRTQATFGAVTEQYVEIISGVSAGDKIITSSYQNYIDFESIDLGGEND